jgi:hypothetical protein
MKGPEMSKGTEAKLAGIYFAIEGLQNRMDGDITDISERKAHQLEINRLIAQMRKIEAKVFA